MHLDMVTQWEKRFIAILLAILAIGAVATGPKPSACSGERVPYCVAERLALPSTPIAIPAAVLPMAGMIILAILATASAFTLRDNGRTRLTLLRRYFDILSPWTHQRRSHLAPLASPHGN